MSKIICISRQSGSNGGIIGEKTAEMLGIPCYDKELLVKAVKSSGIAEELLSKADEKAASKMLYAALYEGDNKEYYGKTANDILFSTQKEVIIDLASKGDCIFVGRCAGDILKKEAEHQVLSVFIAAPVDYRIKKVMDREGIDEKTAAATVRRVDKARRVYYDYYTKNDWGKPSDYDLILNPASIGEDGLCQILAALYKNMD